MRLPENIARLSFCNAFLKVEILINPIDACKNFIRSLSIFLDTSTFTVCSGSCSDEDVSFAILFFSKYLICGASRACI